MTTCLYIQLFWSDMKPLSMQLNLPVESICQQGPHAIPVMSLQTGSTVVTFWEENTLISYFVFIVDLAKQKLSAYGSQWTITGQECKELCLEPQHKHLWAVQIYSNTSSHWLQLVHVSPNIHKNVYVKENYIK